MATKSKPKSPAPKAKTFGKKTVKDKPTPKPSAKPTTPVKAAKPAKPAAAPTSARADLRSSILAKSRAKAAAARPIAFSLDEVRAIAKTVVKRGGTTPPFAAAAKLPPKSIKPIDKLPPTKPNHIKAASLADILGFNPKKSQKSPVDDPDGVPEKFRRYYRLLLQLRSHLTGQLDEHTGDTLKRSAKDDAGDLSSYGQHMADAGTDTFDRDFALSMVANEQEALSEVEAAVQRIKAGTYGMCEATGKPIAKDRLLAVPFTRYSAEAQKDIERNRHHSRTQAGLFGELGEEGAPKMEDDGGGGDE